MAKGKTGGTRRLRGSSMLRRAALPALLTGLVLATRKNKKRARKSHRNRKR